MLCACLCTIVSLSYAQNLTVVNGTLKFSSLAVYEQYADETLDQNEITTLSTSSAALTTLAELDGAEADTLNPDFIKLILNTDKIVHLGSLLVKIDLENHRGLAIADDATNAYATLVANNTTAQGVTVFSDEDDNAMDILIAMEAGTAPPLAERCNRPPSRKVGDPHLIWRTAVGDNTAGCNNNTTAYAMDNKVVYQKAIIYFSLQSKIRSLRACTYSNWILVPTSNQPLKLIANAKYKVRCGTEVIKTKTDAINPGTVLNWRGYQGTRGLSHFDFSATFGIGDSDRNPDPNSPNYFFSPFYRIAEGY